jgi:hypothetical protein
MSFLTAGDLALMRDTLESSLPGTAVIQRQGFTSDGMGGSIGSAWTAVGTVPARRDPVRTRIGEERMFGGRGIGESTWVVVMPEGTDVRRTDRIVLGGTLEVVEVRTPQSWELMTRAECVVV